MTQSRQSPSSEHDVHNELRLRYREFFESQLAIHLLNHPNYFPAVTKVSTAITQLINTHKNIVLQLLQENPKIITELREPFFGSCFDSTQPVTAENAYETILAVLNDKNPDLSKIMQIHCIFIYRIYDHIEKREEKAALASTLKPYSLFNSENRSRVEKKAVQATHQQGIAHHPVFSKMLAKHEAKHLRALDKYEPNDYSSFSQSAREKARPVICGPSGHTASLMIGAKLYGNLTSDELKEYALASFAFLTAGGNHSFHEVFVIANLAGVPYQIDDYATSIPDDIVTSKDYKNLRNHFPEFLR